MEPKNIVPFRLNRLQTLQFAIFDEIEIDEKSVELETGLGFGIDPEQKVVGVNVKFSFHSRKTVFLLIELSCEFLIREQEWTEFVTEDDKIVLPKSLIGHLTVLTIGAVRGALHAKTEGTSYNSYLIPTINVAELVEKDVTLSLTDFGEQS